MDRKIDKKNVEDVLSISPIQEGILFHYLKEPDSLEYVEQLNLTLDGSIDVNCFRETWRTLSENNEILRTIFRWKGLEKPIQIILKQYEIPIREVDLSLENDDEREILLSKIKEKDLRQKIDISNEPFRVTIIKLHECKWEMIITNHHILYDGWSTGILLKEFFEFYDKTINGLQTIKIEKNKYKEFIKWCNRRDVAAQKRYWQKYLEDYNVNPFISIKSTIKEDGKRNTIRKSYSLPSLLVEEIEDFCKKNMITMATFLYTGWGILLGKYNNTSDVVFGTTISGRPPEIHGIEDMVGLFINTLPLRLRTEGSETIINLLEKVNFMLKERTAYENTPLVDVQQYSQLHNTQLFDNIVVIENYPIDQLLKETDGSIKVSEFSMIEETNYNITFSINVFDGIELNVVYQDEYDNSMIDHLLYHYENIISEMVTNPNQELNEIEVLTKDEKQLILETFNKRKDDDIAEKTLHQLFEEQVKKTPEYIAVIWENESLTYQRLNEKANQMASLLLKKGVKTDTVVGIMVERSLEMIIGIMAILKAGGAYLPIDPEYPKDRVEYMLEDSGVGILLTQTQLQPSISFSGDVIPLDNDRLYGNTDLSFNSVNDPKSLAYVIYTSGSTGKPKGVMVEHRAISNTLQARQREYNFKEKDKSLVMLSFAFDGFVTSCFAPLLSGGTAVLLRDEDSKNPIKIKESIKNNRISYFITVPSMYSAILECVTDEEEISSLKIVTLAGEKTTSNIVKNSKMLKSDLEIANEYGPTENSVMSTISRDLQLASTITIGKPIANTQAYIMDRYNKLQPIGIAGELRLAGAGLARGYLNRPDLTMEKFLDHPFADGEKLYKTGDLARWLPDGSIEFLGRVDHQVKIRGYRIELGEIENQLINCSDIEEAVVVAMENEEGGSNYLCGYIVANKSIVISELRQALLQVLPEYMIPSYIIQLEEMPLTPNGKVDRKALPAPDGNIATMVEYEAPGNDVEETLVGIWQDILGVEGIGIRHNFFELGGHSLKATTMVAKIHKAFNVEVPLKEIFRTPTIKDIAELIKASEENIYSAIKRVDEKEYYTTSPAQRRLYTLHQFDKESLKYNMPGAIMLEGNLDVEKLETTFCKLINRHEALRTSFKMIEGEPYQYIHQDIDFNLQIKEAVEGELKDILKNFIQAFDLSHAPLMRVGLIKIAHEKHLLVFDMHHIISDGTSMGILIKEFTELYREMNLDPLRIQYKDYSEWQKELMTSDKIEEQKKYWLQQFEGEIPVLNLLGDYPRPAIQSFEGDRLIYQLEEGLTSSLRKICKATGTTMYMALLSAFNILLSKYTGQEDIIVGSPIAGRPHEDLSSIIGMFVNTLALRNYPSSEKNFKAFLDEVKKNALGAFENQDYQFEELVDHLNLKRDISRNPLFDVMFTMQNMDIGELKIDGLSIKPYDLENKVSKFDITLSAVENDDIIDIEIEYATKLFKKETIERLYGHFKNILIQIAKNTEIKLSEIQLVTEEEKHQILEMFNNTATDYPRNKTIHQLFEEQVEQTPDNIAVVFEDESLTYAMLNERANQLTRVLLEKGVKADTIVGIMVESSLEMLIGIIGILKAGGAYVPIEPDYPEDRINFMLEDSNCGIILTQSHLEDRLDLQGKLVYSLDDPELYRGETCNINHVNSPTDLAYVIYTSGSTGKPKGTMIEHRSVVRLVKNTNYIEFREDDKILQTGAIVFDASTFEIWGALLNGLELHLVDREVILDAEKLEKTMKEKNITILWLTVSLFNQLVQQSVEIFGSCRYLLVGGDALTPKFINLVRSRYPHINIINGYGPTENTTFSNCFRIDQEYTENIPIGGPIANSTGYVLDKYNNLLPIGIVGELCLGGDGLARGYLNRPELTAEKFIDNPFVAGERMYRTGDLARWLPEGKIEFIGRIDHQVKIRGFRIELGEIENQLINYETVMEAIVLPREDEAGMKYLCGYIVAKEEIEITKLRQDLAKVLPEYMIPSYILQLEEMPLTHNGKIDRKALPEPDGNIVLGVEYEAPRNQVEEALVAIWEEILGVKGVGINHNFFELGGHSLKATAMMAKIHKVFNVEIPLKEIFKTPTIIKISELIMGAEERTYATIEPIGRKEYYTTSPAQRRIYTLQQFDKESTGYNIPVAVMLEGDLDVEQLEGSFNKLIERHETLRTTFRMLDGEPVQYIHKAVDFKLQYMETEETDVEGTIRNFVKAFDLSQAPLMRVGLVKVADDRHLLILDMHHIISDGVSLEILIKEFSEFYRGSNLEPLKIQYKDYSEWQKKLMTSGKIEEQKEYWLQQFEEEIPVLNLMGDYPRPSLQNFEGDLINFKLEKDLINSLRKIGKETETTMYMLLLSAFNLLLSKYSGQEDIIIGSPIAGRHHTDLNSIIGMFVNTLAMRNYPAGEKTFTEFLGEVKKNALGAYENQDYQFEELVENLNIRRDMSRNPLFDVMFTMQNMDMEQLQMNGLEIIPYDLKNNISKFDMTFSAIENQESITIGIEYATKIFKKETIERLYRHFEIILKQIIENVDIKLSQIQLVSEEEKHEILEIFNDTRTDYPRSKTLQQLFEEQVAKTPDKTAVVYGNMGLTYRELNEKSNQVARMLLEKDIKPDTMIGIMVERSLEMLIGIIGILKAGGAYVPIEPDYPEDRINFMLEDSNCRIILTQSHLEDRLDLQGKLVYSLDDPELYRGETCNINHVNSPTDLAYVIYTSGSTGKPKGTMIEHRSVVRLVKNTNYIEFREDDKILQTGAIVFDAITFEIWGALLNGLELHLVDREVILDAEKLEKTMKEKNITILWLTVSLFNQLVQQSVEIFGSCRYLLVGGDALTPKFINLVRSRYPHINIINGYGPTENTTFSNCFRIDQEYTENIPIGGPIANSTGYVLDKYNNLLPIGIVGELCLGGDGLARGYLNRPELTAEKFIDNPFVAGERMYRTGDLARWLPEGKIEFIGRVDHQVKIRGFRIELGEIENQLINYETVMEAIVLPREDEAGMKYLCGYIVAKEEIEITKLRQGLAKVLPEYMIPSYILQLEEMPLTHNGKINRKALPEPDGEILIGGKYEAPRNKVEETLVEIWEEVLKVRGIGISHNFFELGGHSLKATAMGAKIHQVLNVDIPLREIFRTPTIKGIAELIKEAEENLYSAIKEVEEKEYYITSAAQRRLYTLQQFDKESTGYNIPGAIILEGNLEVEKLKDVFKKLVERHESLRTSFNMVDGEPVQYIHKEVDFRLLTIDVTEEELEKTLKNFVKAFDLAQAPLMRAGLVKVVNKRNEEAEKHLLVFDMHHIISDGTSIGILIKEFTELYGELSLEPLRIQYKDYSEWQQDLINSGKIEEQKKYWLKQFEGEIPVLNLLGDYPRPVVQRFEGNLLSYRIEEGLTSSLRKISKETGATMYMVLLSAYNILLSKYCGQEDIIIGSPIAGRPHVDLNNIIGMFVNTLAMRNYPVGNKTFKEFLEEVKKNALGAYDHQDYQFEELVDNLNLRRDFSRNPLFDVMFTMQNMDMGELSLEGLSIKPYDLQNNISKFDMTLTAIEAENHIDLSIAYSTNIFKKETIEGFYKHFRNILKQITTNFETKLSDIEMVTKEEKKYLLEDFNDTKAQYEGDQTIHQLFEEQVDKTPDKIAVVFEDQTLTYRQLNEKANQVARQLMDKGVKEDTIVGIMVEKSLEMVIGIIAILKAGGAYLPIDPQYPMERIKYMLEDSGANLLLTQSWLKRKVEFQGNLIAIDDAHLYKGDTTNLGLDYSSDSLVYIIYTSGSTGRPKGVMINHKGLINYITWARKMYIRDTEETFALYSSLTFDLTVTSIYAPLVGGNKVVIYKEEENEFILHKILKDNQTNIIKLTPAHLSLIKDLDNLQSSVKRLIVGGDNLTAALAREIYNSFGGKIEIYNEYGPTETVVGCMIYLYDPKIDLEGSIPIGRPADNVQIYLLDPYLKPVPTGVQGELYISGDGVARGYINRPQLTEEKFIINPFVEGGRMYRTGDLAKRLSSGNIEFLGRIDHQVKIRGYRIEIGEIENRLLAHPHIKEAVVIAKEDAEGNKYLAGYIVADEELAMMEVKEYIGMELPEYMIPTYIIQLVKFPLTQNGKIDRKALPEPEGSIITGTEYEAPRNEIEAVLVEIWKRILSVERIGINDNFFELGGHSLRATSMVAKVHKSFNVEVPLKEVFKYPTIKGIANLIMNTDQKSYSEIEAVEEREYYVTSAAQKRVYTLQQFQLDGTNYNMPQAVVLEGSLNTEKFEKVFKELIIRHESLRTSFKIVEEEPVQYIHKDVDFNIQYIESDEDSIEEIFSDFIKPFDLSKAPLMRVALVKLASDKHLLALDTHHIISDGTSTGILIKEFAELYGEIELEPLRIQYKDYSQWQKKQIDSGKIEEQKKYWLQQFEGEIPVLNLNGDYSRPAIQSFEGNQIGYQLEEGLTTGLREICKETGTTMYMVLLSAYNVLLSKYSGQEDIIIGSPIAGRPHGDLSKIMGMFINTLAMRNRPRGEKTFKEFLNEVKKNALEAYENQDYQFEALVENLNLRRDMSRNPLFDVVFTMQNMDMEQLSIEGLTIKPYDFNNNISKFDITLFAKEDEDIVNIGIEYATKIFKKETMERFYGHFENILRQMVEDIEVKLSEVELVTDNEKQQLLEAFNDTKIHYPRQKTIHQLFEEQVERTADNIAVVYEGKSLTYSELNAKANQVARLLVEKGVKPNTTVGIMVERSLEMIIGMLGVLKAGVAYLPIDPEYPRDRVSYMLEDSETKILLLQSGLGDELEFSGEVVYLDQEGLYQGDGNNISSQSTSEDLAYVIYTSGSTGKPKGVLVEHRTIVNTLSWRIGEYNFTPEDTVIQIPSFAFDSSVEDIFTPLLSGGKLVLLKQSNRLNIGYLTESILLNNGTHLLISPAFYQTLLKEAYEDLKNLRMVTIAGESFTTELVKEHFAKLEDVELYNEYGPTENSVCSTIYKFNKEDIKVVIGKPISNSQCYILGKNNQLQPIGVAGELVVGGAGLTRGYLNRPELTAEKFVDNPFVSGERMYRTGDLARWLSDGNIEFLGRTDHQVKIRGFRIELGEIESSLLKISAIKEAAVIAREDQWGSKYLCAYIAVKETIQVSDIKDSLSINLPEYMIPQFIIILDKLPLTTNGKVDRQALPEPQGNEHGVEYVAPENEVEEGLVEIWQSILNRENIGTKDNFFELGGHSLRATAMVAKIHKAFNIEVSLMDIFKKPTIRGIAELINVAEENTYLAIEAVEEKEYYPTSPAQRRLFTLQQLDKDSLSYNVPGAIILDGRLDIEKLEDTFRKLIERHEALRTSFMLMKEEPVQYIHKAVDFKLDYMEATEEELAGIIKEFVKPFDFSQNSLLRVGLVRVNSEKHLLIFDMHHIISDGTSMGILVKEFSDLYRGINLAPLRIQYKDYSEWQKELFNSGKIEEQKQYWLQQFEEEIPVLNLIGDYPRPALQSFEGNQIGYSLEEGLTTRLREICKKTGVTMYMVLLSAFNVLLSKYSGQEDIVVGSPIAARPHADLSNVMGMFVNTLAMRNYPKGEKSFNEFLEEVKGNALEAYKNQDYQFEELVENLDLRRDMSRNPLFDVMLVTQNMEMQAVEMDELTIKPYQVENDTSKFDITMFTMETEKELKFNLEYSTKIFKKETIERFYRHFERILNQIANRIDIKISEIDLMTEEEDQLLKEFNSTKADYPKSATIHQLFEEQAEKTPDNIAITLKDGGITYRELNEKSNQLARVLREKGVTPNTTVGIMMERSFDMIIGIVAILKSGAAYLPIDIEYPAERIEYMLQNTNIVISHKDYMEKVRFEGEILNISEEDLYRGDNTNLPHVNSSEDLLYILYTSGSTGRPKGVMLEHRNLVNLILHQYGKIDIDFTSKVLQYTTICFDVSFQEIFSTLLKGGTLHLISSEEQKNPKALFQFINEKGIEVVFLPTSFLKFVLSQDDFIKIMPSCINDIITAGEQLVVTDEFRKYLRENKVRLHNHYGPTEAHVVTTYEITPDAEIPKLPPIGKPISNTKIYIVNQEGRQNPVGIAGELLIAGDCVGRGYLNNPELTAEKFIENPFVAGERMYRTGDLARWLPDGNIEFLGRIDHQVKIRGYRIELGEIENQLLNQKDIKEAVVLVKEDQGGTKYLSAYVVIEGNTMVSEIRSEMAAKLPEYMIPAYIMELKEIPLTPNGKVDRSRLPEGDGKILTEMEYEAPRNSTEEILVEIWHEVLGIKGIGINDNFFELGGHSLKATSMMAKIHKSFNVEVPLKEIFKTPTIKGIADLIMASEENIYSAIKVVEEKEYYSTSPAQRRLYTVQQFDKESTGYNMPGAIILEGCLEAERLEGVFEKLIERHEALRTSFKVVEGEVVQFIHKEVDFSLQYMEVEEGKIEDILKNFVKAFDLSKAPLIRGELVKVAHEKHLLIFDMHHIISDGTSISILIKEFAEIYGEMKLEPLKIQYKDYSEWQKELISSGKIEEQKKYWLQQFEGDIPVLNLMGDYPRPALQSFEGNSLRYTVDEDLTNSLRKLCKKTGATMYMVLLSACNVLLSKYTGQEDIIIGSPIAGRPHEDLSKIMGMFINTLAMRNHPVGEKSFKEFLYEVKKNALGAYENQDYQFEELVDNLNLRRDISRNPLFDVMFTMQNMEMNELIIDGVTIKSYNLKNNISKFDMTFSAMENQESITIGIEYATKIFKKETIERLYRHFEIILKQIIENVDIKLSQIQLVSEEEKHEILEIFNDTRTDYPRSKTLQQLFEEQVAKTPDKTAVVYGNMGLTYRELNEKSNQVARKLLEKDIKPDTMVGIMVERSLEMIIGVIGILKAGGAYVPIEPDYPEDRINFMLEDSNCRIILTQSHLEDRLDLQGKLVYSLDDPELYRGETCNINHVNSPTDLAYVIYTSGSTGKPKGTMIEHRSVVRLVKNTNYIEFREDDKILQTGAIVFDAITFEIWGALLNGLELHLVDREVILDAEKLEKTMKEKNITILWLTVSLFNQLVQQSVEIFGSCRYLLVGGDALTPKFINLVRSRYPHINIINGYGPTENTTFSNCFRIDQEYTENIPIGGPIANSTGYVLDKYNNLLPIGIVGELCLGGDGLARGYLNRPELTAEKFIDNPFVAGERMYRTGDLARWLPEGKIEFIGRIDHQVKIRGFRIELGEIENQLINYETVMEAIVLPREDEAGMKYLCGYIVAKEEIEITKLRQGLAKVLPEYMIPSYILQLEEMPLTHNGKIDRKALPEPDGEILIGGKYEAPRNKVEETLVEIWEEVLKVKGIGLNHNFFELGGHSLKATSMISIIHNRFNIEIPLKELFKNPTIKALGEYIMAGDEKQHSVIEAIPKAEYYPLSSAQKRIYIQGQVDEKSTAYNMPFALILEGKLDEKRLEDAINGLLERHEALRSSFVMVDGLVMQKVDEKVRINIDYMEAEEDELHQFTEGFIKPFNLTQSPLLRVALIKCGELKHLLLFDQHHIISDGVSTSILTRDFMMLYEGKDLSPLKIQYKDYAVWHNSILESERMKELEKYWFKKLDDFAETNLPVNYSSSNRKGHTFNVLIDEELNEKINEFCIKHRITKAVLILGVFKVIIGKTINQNKVSLGIPVAGRRHSQLEDIIGVFLNVLMISTNISYDDKFLDFLLNLKDEFMEAQDHQDYPYELLHEAVSKKLMTQYNSLFSILFNYMPYQEEGDLNISGLNIKPYQFQEPEAKYGLTLYVREGKDRIMLNALYDGQVDGFVIEKILLNIPTIIEEIVEKEEIIIKELFAPKETQDVLEEFDMMFDDNDDFF